MCRSVPTPRSSTNAKGEYAYPVLGLEASEPLPKNVDLRAIQMGSVRLRRPLRQLDRTCCFESGSRSLRASAYRRADLGPRTWERAQWKMTRSLSLNWVVNSWNCFDVCSADGSRWAERMLPPYVDKIERRVGLENFGRTISWHTHSEVIISDINDGDIGTGISDRRGFEENGEVLDDGR